MATNSNKDNKICIHCNKTFFDSSTRNKHVKRIHQIVPDVKKKQNILCPLCLEDVLFTTYQQLNTHINIKHNILVELLTFTFSSDEEYQQWIHMENIERNYIVSNTVINTEFKQVFYSCNRSNIKGILIFVCSLKTYHLGKRTNIKVEKLLDAIEDLVDNKMWQRILNIERPTSQTYQDKSLELTKRQKV